ncbi:MAG: glycerophosphodiester phosphodiesterase family protein [Porticoccaceae bacterium]
MSSGALPIERLVAHRGYQAKYPENSLIGIEAALAAGIVNIECDVQFSGDGVAMLYHDLNLNRVSGLPGTILDYSCAELQKLPAGEPGRLGEQFSDVRIDPLSDLLPLVEQYRQTRFFIEIKSETLHQIGREAAIAQLCQLFTAHADRVVMISFDIEVIRCARELDWPLCGVVLSDPEQASSETLLGIDPDYIYIDQLLISNHFRAQEQVLNAQWVAYEVVDKTMGWRLLERGFGLLESFDTLSLAEPI